MMHGALSMMGRMLFFGDMHPSSFSLGFVQERRK